MIEVRRGVGTVGDTEMPTLSKLTTLESIGSSFHLLKHIKNCQLKTMKVSYDSQTLQNREPLLNFLTSQNSLKELELDLEWPDALFQDPIPCELIKFRLKKLSLCIDLRETPNKYNNLMEFMKLHLETLEELVLEWKFPDFFYEFIFAKFKQLKTLSLYGHDIPRESSFYERLKKSTLA